MSDPQTTRSVPDEPGGSESGTATNSFQQAPISRRDDRVFGFLWMAVLIIVGLSQVARPREMVPGRPSGRLQHRLNPNNAPWWELATLPRLGRTTAANVVLYRDSVGERPAFRQPADLERVHGVGPKTVRRLIPHIRFTEEPVPFVTEVPGRLED